MGRGGGEDDENGQAESASEQPAYDPHNDNGDDDRHDHPDQEDTDAIDKIVECSSDCCKPDREGPNQPKSRLILSATKCVQAGSLVKHSMYKKVGSANIPGLFCVRQEIALILHLLYFSLSGKLLNEHGYFHS